MDIRDELTKRVLGENTELVEAKSADKWWDGLKSAQREAVSNILGLGKGKNTKFAKLDTDEQDEVTSYHRKHKGKVEDSGLNEGDEMAMFGRAIMDIISVKSALLEIENNVGRKMQPKVKGYRKTLDKAIKVLYHVKDNLA